VQQRRRCTEPCLPYLCLPADRRCRPHVCVNGSSSKFSLKFSSVAAAERNVKRQPSPPLLQQQRWWQGGRGVREPLWLPWHCSPVCVYPANRCLTKIGSNTSIYGGCLSVQRAWHQLETNVRVSARSNTVLEATRAALRQGTAAVRGNESGAAAGHSSSA
jgi:hypothetical protein